MPWINQTIDVIVEDKHHQGKEEEQAHLLGQLAFFDAEWLAHNPFNAEKKEMTTVEYWNGEEV